MHRCDWCGTDPLYIAYHDTEWGVPVRDGRMLFEQLSLEAFQAGLSWITILRKRDNFRRAFAGFDAETLAGWGQDKTARLLADAGIVRHRGKIEATLGNARAVLGLGGPDAFADLVWAAVDGTPLRNAPATLADVPAQTPASQALSKTLKSRGFRFFGPTTAYAFMQAAGLVNDHLVTCPRHGEIA